MKKLFDIFFLAGAITILIIGLYTSQSYNYDVFLRWYIFLYSVYLIFSLYYTIFKNRTLKEEVFFDMALFIVISLILISMAIIYNPFKPLTFLKEIRPTIDSVILFLASIILIGILIKQIEDYLKSPSARVKEIYKITKEVCNLIMGSLLVLGWMLAVIWLVFYGTEKYYHEFLLITQASTAKGVIIASKPQESKVDVEYIFVTKDGKTIKNWATLYGPKLRYFTKVFDEVTKTNFKPVPIEVEYITSNPKINRLKDLNSQSTTIWGLIESAGRMGLIFLFLFTLSFFYICGIINIDFWNLKEIRKGITNYVIKIKEIRRAIKEIRHKDMIAKKMQIGVAEYYLADLKAADMTKKVVNLDGDVIQAEKDGKGVFVTYGAKVGKDGEVHRDGKNAIIVKTFNPETGDFDPSLVEPKDLKVVSIQKEEEFKKELTDKILNYKGVNIPDKTQNKPVQETSKENGTTSEEKSLY